jgi:hypothetical protein
VKAADLSLFQIEKMFINSWSMAREHKCSVQIVLVFLEYMISLDCIKKEGASFI